MKIKLIFAKTDYEEIRNCNGDIIKIPKKKLPLRKKQVNNNIFNKKVIQEENKIVTNYHGPIGLYI